MARAEAIRAEYEASLLIKETVVEKVQGPAHVHHVVQPVVYEEPVFYTKKGKKSKYGTKYGRWYGGRYGWRKLDEADNLRGARRS